MTLEPHSVIIRMIRHQKIFVSDAPSTSFFEKRQKKKFHFTRGRSCVRFTSNAFPLKQITNIIFLLKKIKSSNNKLYTGHNTDGSNQITKLITVNLKLFDGQGKYLFAVVFDLRIRTLKHRYKVE